MMTAVEYVALGFTEKAINNVLSVVQACELVWFVFVFPFPLGFRDSLDTLQQAANVRLSKMFELVSFRIVVRLRKLVVEFIDQVSILFSNHLLQLRRISSGVRARARA